MNNITVDKFVTRFWVETVHGSDLDFVLHDTGERIKGDSDYYVDRLIETINEWLKPFDNASVTESSRYGSVYICVEFSNHNELIEIMTACSSAIVKWTNKYHINKMKQNA